MDVLGEGRFLRLVSHADWEYVHRKGCSGIVAIVAVTPERRLLLVEQWRPPVSARVIELPAGLVGDEADYVGEPQAVAASRELEEETGWRAGRLEPLLTGPLSAGMTSEQIAIWRAHDLRKVSAGGGDATEDIEVHAVELSDVAVFLADALARGALVDPKVYASLWWLGVPGPDGLHPESRDR